ncbi:hypothetical protein [Roseibium litorale]|uniref:Uncharacterized protein n=1 Tax=Roseibium litorale TaxID=2803841 RepID=A0ABR9CIT0_9HYPH|nr:hypothetical protein [Roseibium litorale]MBD8890729.1 hypothetical protein [Roseibium litorale]
MPDHYADPVAEPVELEFVRGHIAATMTLVLGLIDQGVIDRLRLDTFFAGFISELPHTRDTLGLRLVLDQWRDGLRSGRDEGQLRQAVFEVIEGGRE